MYVYILLYNMQCICVSFLVTLSCPTFCDPKDYNPPGSSVHGDSRGKKTEMGSYFLLQGIFSTQGLNSGLLHYRWILHQLSHQRSPSLQPPAMGACSPNH